MSMRDRQLLVSPPASGRRRSPKLRTKEILLHQFKNLIPKATGACGKGDNLKLRLELPQMDQRPYDTRRAHMFLSILVC